MKYKVRKFLRRLLGVDYNHILRVIDYSFLKGFAEKSVGKKTYDKNAVVYRWSDAEIKIG
jgi:hypothetical protein